MGSNPTIPGDLVGEPGPPLTGKQLKDLLHGLRKNASRPPVETTHNREQAVNYPDLSTTSHVYVKKGKVTPLGPKFEGPFEIVERLGKSCVKLRVGVYSSGEDRFEVQHWSNLKPAAMTENEMPATRAKLGRKPLNPKAKDYVPQEDPAYLPNSDTSSI